MFIRQTSRKELKIDVDTTGLGSFFNILVQSTYLRGATVNPHQQGAESITAKPLPRFTHVLTASVVSPLK